jgi:hypothetical protein
VELTYRGIDRWDRLVFTGDNGRYYKTTELAPKEGFELLSMEAKYNLLKSLHRTDCFDGEPDFPCFEEGKFTLNGVRK